jgi:hypothetical protein
MEHERQPPLFEMHGEGEAAQKEGPRPEQQAAGAQPCTASGSEQPRGEITFDGSTYHYTGYALEEGRYVRRQARFTPDELDIYASEPLWRVCASVDRAGRDAGRQAEIKRYGKRVWHSPYRQQDVAMQGLDYIFRHDVDKVAACYPYAVALYGGDAALADRWTAAMFDAYKSYALHGNRQPLCRLLAEAGIPLAVLGEFS